MIFDKLVGKKVKVVFFDKKTVIGALSIACYYDLSGKEVFVVGDLPFYAEYVASIVEVA